MTKRLLFMAAEYDGLAKVGGLADVAASLPRALIERGWDVRVLLPTYGCIRGINDKNAPVIAKLPGAAKDRQVLIREYRTADESAPVVWLVDTPATRRRVHNPYTAPDGVGWQEDAMVFGDFCRAAAKICGEDSPLPWRPDLVHANEWHCGLLPVYLLLQKRATPSMFTIHNLAYQGRFPAAACELLDLPRWLYHPDAIEFHGQISFMKAGLIFADALTAVSPAYADEILTPAFGEGLDGVLRTRRHDLQGILNGIDMNVWNPARDPALIKNYSARNINGKQLVKQALLHSLHLEPCAPEEPLCVFVGRLTPQKGIDLLLGALPRLMRMPLRIAVLGAGDDMLQHALREAAIKYRGRFALRLRYDETLAHRFFGGGDILLMPSHFEPCGLAQMYAMRYGAIPVTSAVGGLRDTVIPAGPQTIENEKATGFLFEPQTVDAFLGSVDQALKLFCNKNQWQQLMRTAMRKDFGWKNAAREYERLYSRALARGAEAPLRARLRPAG